MTNIMNNTLIFLIFTVSLLSTTLTGCIHRYAFGDCTQRVKTAECYKTFSHDTDLTAASFTAADHLMRNGLMDLHPQSRILVTTLADIDNLTDSTPLGRLVGEQLAVRFAQKGYTVTEAKLYNHIILLPYRGEFVLTRYLRDTGLIQKADIAVAGTYAVGKDTVYVTLKMLDCQTSKVIASHAYTLPIGPNTYALLQRPTWW
jgi:hypothetical protein